MRQANKIVEKNENELIYSAKEHSFSQSSFINELKYNSMFPVYKEQEIIKKDEIDQSLVSNINSDCSENKKDEVNYSELDKDIVELKTNDSFFDLDIKENDLDANNIDSTSSLNNDITEIFFNEIDQAHVINDNSVVGVEDYKNIIDDIKLEEKNNFIKTNVVNLKILFEQIKAKLSIMQSYKGFIDTVENKIENDITEIDNELKDITSITPKLITTGIVVIGSGLFVLFGVKYLWHNGFTYKKQYVTKEITGGEMTTVKERHFGFPEKGLFKYEVWNKEIQTPIKEIITTENTDLNIKVLLVSLPLMSYLALNSLYNECKDYTKKNIFLSTLIEKKENLKLKLYNLKDEKEKENLIESENIHSLVENYNNNVKIYSDPNLLSLCILNYDKNQLIDIDILDQITEIISKLNE